MLASEVLTAMKRKTRNARITIAVLAIVLILENLLLFLSIEQCSNLKIF